MTEKRRVELTALGKYCHSATQNDLLAMHGISIPDITDEEAFEAGRRIEIQQAEAVRQEKDRRRQEKERWAKMSPTERAYAKAARRLAQEQGVFQ
jgi:hypothetical protein